MSACAAAWGRFVCQSCEQGGSSGLQAAESGPLMEGALAPDVLLRLDQASPKGLLVPAIFPWAKAHGSLPDSGRIVFSGFGQPLFPLSEEVAA